jgi:hypothetical protein
MELIVCHCGQAYRTDTNHIGKAIKCRLCGEIFVITQENPTIPKPLETPIKSEAVPVWNKLVMVFPIGAFLWGWAVSAHILVGIAYAIGCWGYVLFGCAFRPGKFPLLRLKTRFPVIVAGLLALIISSASMIVLSKFYQFPGWVSR